MSYIIAIDPGNELSGYAILNTEIGFPGRLIEFGKVSEKELKNKISAFYLECSRFDVPFKDIHSAIEMVASYGMAVGQTVFDTCAVIGRIEQYITTVSMLTNTELNNYGINKQIHRVYRKKVSAEKITATTMELCKTTRAKDSNIRAAILDLYPASGGGKTPQVGIKSNPGPLFGVSNDVWSALAVGLTFQRWLEK